VSTQKKPACQPFALPYSPGCESIAGGHCCRQANINRKEIKNMEPKDREEMIEILIQLEKLSGKLTKIRKPGTYRPIRGLLLCADNRIREAIGDLTEAKEIK
jgi:hypothetical protein